MVLVSGVLDGGAGAFSPIGVALGLGAAVLYASVVLLNKRLSGMSAYDTTITQLACAAVVLLPYVLLTDGFGLGSLDLTGWLLLITVGIVHTGLAYAMYFAAMGRLKTQTVAILSYLDPVLAIILSALILDQSMDGWQIAGTILVLGSALYSELPERQR